MRFKKSPLLFNISKLIVFLLTSRREVPAVREAREARGAVALRDAVSLSMKGK